MNKIQNGTELIETILEYCDFQYQTLYKRLNITSIIFLLLSGVVLILGLFRDIDWFQAFFPILMGAMFIALTFFGPGKDNFMAVSRYLKFLKNGSLCELNMNSKEKYMQIKIFIPAKNFTYLRHEESKNDFLSFIKRFFPDKKDYKYYLEIYPIIFNNSINSLSIDIDKILKSNLYSSAVSLPNDIAEKAKDLSEVYLYLYVVENSLRMFIRNVAIRNFGNNYFPQLKITRDIQKSITVRKENEEKNKWLSLRGNEELFYLDFKDLATVIGENWDLFKGHFDSQPWIRTKIEELANIRNLVAHNNSFIDQHNKDVLRINYHQILKQIANT